MVEDGAEELEDLVHFSVSELPSRGYGVMEEIRRQGKLCDVTLKGYKTQRPREEEQLPAARTEQPCRAELHGPAVLSLDSTSRRTCVCLLNWGPL